MKILYGVQGTGNGHISRAREMARAFDQLGVSVDFHFSGRPAEDYFDMACFGDYRTSKGLTFITEHGKVNQWQTFRRNSLLNFWQEVKAMDLSGYDLVINDFEPVSAWAARRQGIPSLGLSHQSAFLYDVPKEGESWLDRRLIRFFAPTDQPLGLHWYHFGAPILPPIVPQSTGLAVQSDGAILVYLPFEALDQVLAMLTRFSAVTFYCYHPSVRQDYQQDNVQVCALSRTGFHQRLAVCDGVIANGGFELPSEAIALGKKLLLKPLQGQYEQLSNVATLELMGLAVGMHSLDAAALRNWLDSHSPGQVIWPDVALAVARWLQEENRPPVEALCQSLWEPVSFPEPVLEIVSDLSPNAGLSGERSLITGTY
ncbi:MJ1255/VC2487 family glycosyltransferase [Photobacterium sp. TLY01]|uniref:MJ1255/VC2487 family glycosyltransferase n=1 Tax=Photobacterium sp. TLY01 TaxID=2907534 RepID=UPI001F3A91A7|nr:MJ1255/VC2487 family glycosyltransferase [Photobacterium sp. TLY01]UIP27604.1 glycosyltransferase [Photobacterium sp. TLY01]